ncbi:MAG: hypothetical protein PHD70_00845 [Anaerostipes sp.]|jgi:small-conductance mechanosensitive channel|nr:hypothetical protein [Anaerostipes sp.]
MKTTGTSKKNFTIIGIAVVLIIAVGVWYFTYKRPYDIAVSKYNAASEKIDKKNVELNGYINKAQKLINSKKEPLEKSTITNAKDSIKNAKKVRRNVPDAPKKISVVKKETLILEKGVDYSKQISELQKSTTELDKSIQQLEQVTNPSQKFVLASLKKIKSINNVKAVTEKNDPNGSLNKTGGYTAAIYFSSPKVDHSFLSGKDSIGNGTDGGGCIEVYKTKENADTRNKYLAAFDSTGMMNPGSHKVIGTIIVRTSSQLTATQQKNLEKELIDALIKL